MTDAELKGMLPSLRPRLVVQARRMTGDQDAAEDIVQDAMLKLWMIRDRLIGPPGRLAQVMVRNMSLDYLRKTKRHNSLTEMEKMEIADIHADDEGDPVGQLLSVVSKLPKRQQAILRMHYMEGTSYKEMSLITGMSETALRKTASRARRELLLRMIASASAVIALVIAVNVGWGKYQDMRLARLYEGSYVIEGGQRNDNLREIRPQIEEALAQARKTEASADPSSVVRQAEESVLQSISDPEERRMIEQLLSE